MTTSKPNLLWIWRDQPTRLGLGSQQRAGHILAALARYFQLHVVVLNEGDHAMDTTDHELLAVCTSRLQIIALDPTGETIAPRPLPEDWFPLVTMERQKIPAYVADYFRQIQAEMSYLFAFDVVCFLGAQLRHLQPAFLDLDELLSHRQIRFVGCGGLAAHELADAKKRISLFQMMERQYLPLFEEIMVSSEVECTRVSALIPREKVTFIPNATRWNEMLPPPARKGPHVLFFVGTMAYFPNQDAVAFFLREVWPKLRARYSDGIQLHLAGAKAPASFRPETVDGVIFERDPADLLPAYRRASVVIVPIRAGGGTRVKILEAFALGRPVVSTTLGAEGLEVESGRHLLLADNPQAFADACMELLDDPAKAQAITVAAARWIETRNSASAVAKAVAKTRLVSQATSSAT